MKVDLKASEIIVNKLFGMRKDMVVSSLAGDFKAYNRAHKDYASLAVDHFELAQKMPFPEIKVPVFSKEGFNLIKTAFLNLFTPKTIAQKKLKSLCAQAKMEQKYFDKLA